MVYQEFFNKTTIHKIFILQKTLLVIFINTKNQTWHTYMYYDKLDPIR